jgi:hypothetical protein
VVVFDIIQVFNALNAWNKKYWDGPKGKGVELSIVSKKPMYNTENPRKK